MCDAVHGHDVLLAGGDVSEDGVAIFAGAVGAGVEARVRFDIDEELARRRVRES